MFSRVTLVAATELLVGHSQAEFDQMVVRLELEQAIPADPRMSVRKKSAELARIVLRSESQVETLEGRMSLWEAVVREAVAIARQGVSRQSQEQFTRALAHDGYSLTWKQDGTGELRPALPVELGVKMDDEVHQLLADPGFATARGHLDQALDAHVRGDWASANAQLRTFMEEVLDEIARVLLPDKANSTTSENRPKSENRRALLGEAGFFSEKRNEWTKDGKNYVNGLFKMLHTDGSHAGLSDVEHSTFRLQVVLVTARTFLRRLHDWE